MDLIPNTPGDFRRREYWDAVFGSRNSESLEWYGNYEDFAEIFEEYLRRGSDATTEKDKERSLPEKVSPFQRPVEDDHVGSAAVDDTDLEKTREQDPLVQTETRTDNTDSNKTNPDGNHVSDTERRSVDASILHVGCGDSELSERLTRSGYGRVVNVDFSSVVIERMKRKYRHVPNLSWECFDVRGRALERRFGEEAFDAVVDKGFFDALATRDVKEEQPGVNEGEQRYSVESASGSVKRLETNAGSSDVLSRGGLECAAEKVTTEQQGTCKGQKANKDRSEMSAYRDEAQEYLLSALKVLKTGGVFIIITLAQDYVVKELVRGFYAANVHINIHPLPLATSRRMAAKAGLKHQSLLPFIFCVKKKHGSGSGREIASRGAQMQQDSGKEKKAVGFTASKCVMKAELGRAATEDVFVIWDLPKKIRAVIEWRLLQVALCVRDPGSRSVVSIHSCGIQNVDTHADDFPRYVVTIYDVLDPRAQKKDKTYTRATAAILAAAGEERCWLFATAEGNEELARQAGAKRILIVTPGAQTPNGGSVVEGVGQPDVGPDAEIQRVSEELGPYLADLALPDSGDIPIMMVGSGTTRVVAERARERSEFAGWITVRDVEVSDDEETLETPVPRDVSKRKQNPGAKSKQGTHSVKACRKNNRQKALRRQLLFYCSPHTVQSEVKLTKSAPECCRDDDDESSSFAFLQPVSGYYIPAAAAFALLREAREPRADPVGGLEAGRSPRISAVVLGLGGGVLSMFLHTLLGEALSLELTSVDIDPVVVELARKHFGFREFPGRLQCVLDDATAYVKRLPLKSVHVIIVDINSGSPASAMRCPAEDFVREDMLTNMKKALVPGGLLVFNLLCRCLRTKNEVMERLSAIFPSVSSIPISEDANEVVVCQVDGPHVELPSRRGVVDRHLRELVHVLEGYASTCERDKEDIMNCALRLLNCAKEWRVQACRNATESNSR